MNWKAKQKFQDEQCNTHLPLSVFTENILQCETSEQFPMGFNFYLWSRAFVPVFRIEDQSAGLSFHYEIEFFISSVHVFAGVVITLLTEQGKLSFSACLPKTFLVGPFLNSNIHFFFSFSGTQNLQSNTFPCFQIQYIFFYPQLRSLSRKKVH